MDINPHPVPWNVFKLPPFPRVALRVMQMAANENVEFRRLSELVASDQVFATEILSLANSFIYAPRYPIKTILQAIEVLGIQNLQGLCLTVGVRSYLGKYLRHPTMRTLWRHNVATAMIAEQIASAGSMERDVAYTSGVLHDIGRLALAVVRPNEYIDLLGRHVGNSASILEREQALFGLDHCQVGARLVDEWNLPKDFVPIMADHHMPPKQDGRWGMTELLNLSCRMADAVGYGAFPACQATPFAELLEELPPRERNLFHADVETLAFEVSKKIGAVEAA